MKLNPKLLYRVLLLIINLATQLQKDKELAWIVEPTLLDPITDIKNGRVLFKKINKLSSSFNAPSQLWLILCCPIFTIIYENDASSKFKMRIWPQSPHSSDPQFSNSQESICFQ